MYNITQEDFLLIREEALHPIPDENAYAVTFAVMERMFPGYLYARQSSFPCREDLEDCMTTAQIRIVERLRRYYFEREDMEQSPESLQRWMFTVLKNCHYNILQQTESGREMLRKMEQKVRTDMGITYANDGQLRTEESADPATDGGFDALFRKEEIADRRALLKTCFEEILNGKSDVQIILAWLSVSTLMLVKDIKKKDAIALIADTDPTMAQLFRLLLRLMAELPWLEVNAEEFAPMAKRLSEEGTDGRRIGDLRFGDFTAQTPREYISKSINKRNDTLSARHRDEELF